MNRIILSISNSNWILNYSIIKLQNLTLRFARRNVRSMIEDWMKDNTEAIENKQNRQKRK